ncbi:hypothetical protein Tsubulata_031799 [Turnera subulata]|uniref:PRONE domain-containing protein n=1 Tax=Turnera subulata TaxID=218843 RepID=A0A9Q0GIF6_9ROSI|nr:hypothetical protein Tsubulata_031799 [Turnera subulata]
MVRALIREHSIQKTRSFSLKKMLEVPARQFQNLVLDNDKEGGGHDDKSNVKSPPQLRSPVCRERLPVPAMDVSAAKPPPTPGQKQPSEIDLMKDRFAKLLLGEDMSGGGKGVSSALALSNAITNLAASIFGEQKRLEPMSAERKTRWRREIDWLLSVTDYIVELVPSHQSKDGINMEIMVTRQRNDLLMNIPALRKLDAILVDALDEIGNQNEFWYVSKDNDSEQGNTTPRNDDKWWLPVAKVPENGLSEKIRRWLQFQKDAVNQVLKAAMAINAQVLSEMLIPENYIESLPKNGRSSLGDSIYRSITVEHFDPEQFLSSMDMTTEHKVLDLKNRIEASIIIWKRKMIHKDGKSSWGSAVSLEKRELFEERAETILLLLKQRFPSLPQSSLEISKIQYNKDVGKAILESYSRIIESLASTVLARIEEVIQADAQTQGRSESGDKSEEEATHTLLDFMGWNDQVSNSMKINSGHFEENMKGEIGSKNTPKKHSYVETLENGSRSPLARQYA